MLKIITKNGFPGALKMIFRFSQMVKYNINPNKYTNFSQEDLIKLTFTPSLPFNEKILIYASLKKQYSFRHIPLEKMIVSGIAFCEQVSPLLGVFLLSYEQICIQCLKYYIDYYSNIKAPAIEQLVICKYLLAINMRKIKDAADTWIVQTAKLKNKDNLMRLFLTSSFNFSQFIQFMRMSISSVDKKLFQAYIMTRYEEPSTNQQKILLCYMCSLLSISLNKYEIPRGTKDPKSICMLLQLMKVDNKKQISDIIDAIDFKNWTYDNIIWISEYLNQQQLTKAHQQLIKTKLTDITTLILFIRRLPKQKYPEICTWLCQQLSNIDIFQQWKVEDLLQLIQQLPRQAHFNQYLSLLAKQSRGRLSWEQTTGLYYYCRLWGIETDDVDALRIYVVNGYTSMGTARTRIPTSSYYYKLIQIVAAKQLFQYKVPFN